MTIQERAQAFYEGVKELTAKYQCDITAQVTIGKEGEMRLGLRVIDLEEKPKEGEVVEPAT